MRVPSKKSFTALEENITENEWNILNGNFSEDYDSEHVAYLFLTALRNGVPLTEAESAEDSKLVTSQRMQDLIRSVNPAATVNEIESFFWSIPLDADDDTRIYLTSAFLSYGQSFSSLLSSFRVSNNSSLPDFVPVAWFKKFFAGEASLREEGIVLQADVSMILFGYWTIDEVVDFLIRNVDLKEVTKLRSYGVEDLDEIADMTELLPSEWLDDFFS